MRASGIGHRASGIGLGTLGLDLDALRTVESSATGLEQAMDMDSGQYTTPRHGPGSGVGCPEGRVRGGADGSVRWGDHGIGWAVMDVGTRWRVCGHGVGERERESGWGEEMRDDASGRASENGSGSGCVGFADPNENEDCLDGLIVGLTQCMKWMDGSISIPAETIGRGRFKWDDTCERGKPQWYVCGQPGMKERRGDDAVMTRVRETRGCEEYLMEGGDDLAAVFIRTSQTPYNFVHRALADFSAVRQRPASTSPRTRTSGVDSLSRSLDLDLETRDSKWVLLYYIPDARAFGYAARSSSVSKYSFRHPLRRDMVFYFLGVDRALFGVPCHCYPILSDELGMLGGGGVCTAYKINAGVVLTLTYITLLALRVRASSFELRVKQDASNCASFSFTGGFFEYLVALQKKKKRKKDAPPRLASPRPASPRPASPRLVSGSGTKTKTK
ncbi:hypothetical protein B0H34DRAFT_676556 [Crassisporium funariophilum]|nr:hypothetical protein B0H34DRAFT_676556 [Crassisporium funariophilum]